MDPSTFPEEFICDQICIKPSRVGLPKLERGIFAVTAHSPSRLLTISKAIVPLAVREDLSQSLVSIKSSSKIRLLQNLSGGQLEYAENGTSTEMDLSFFAGTSSISATEDLDSESLLPLDLDEANKIIQRNAFEVPPGHRTFGLFAVASLYNHSCAPNALWRPLPPENNRLIVHTITTVPLAQEIFINYSRVHMPLLWRRQQLLPLLQKHCKCQRCMQEEELLKIYPAFANLSSAICESSSPLSFQEVLTNVMDIEDYDLNGNELDNICSSLLRGYFYFLSVAYGVRKDATHVMEEAEQMFKKAVMGASRVSNDGDLSEVVQKAKHMLHPQVWADLEDVVKPVTLVVPRLVTPRK